MTTPREFLLTALTKPETPLRFEKFMEAALYHPEFGYYTTEILDVGRTGDFSTSATLHSVLGEAIAKWAVDTRKSALPRGRWNLIEVGAGNGELAHTVLRNIPRLQRRELRYHIVEKSPILLKRQKEKLGNPCQWHDCMQDALAATDGTALIFSNELVDAFPCRLFEWDGSVWQEIALELDGEKFRERLMVVGLPDSTAFQIPNPQSGQRVEIHESYRNWLQSWKGHWETGAMLTIDYGDVVDQLYHRRPNGTLRAYHHQQRIEGTKTYHHMGQQDLTADVNFSDLQIWVEQIGWKNARLETQRDFILRTIPQASRLYGTDPAAQFLLHPEGAGEAFKVLEQWIT